MLSMEDLKFAIEKVTSVYYIRSNLYILGGYDGT